MGKSRVREWGKPPKRICTYVQIDYPSPGVMYILWITLGEVKWLDKVHLKNKQINKSQRGKEKQE